MENHDYENYLAGKKKYFEESASAVYHRLHKYIYCPEMITREGKGF